MRGLCMLIGSVGAIVALSAQPVAATADEAAWFAGEWAVWRVAAEGFETVGETPLGKVTIAHRGGAEITRTTRLADGTVTTVAFAVKKLGETYPWRTKDGASVVVRKVAEDRFLLAKVGPMGKARWDEALEHRRMAKAAAAPAPAADGMAVVVFAVKPDRVAQFEAYLRDFEVILGELSRAGTLDEPGRRDYKNLRVFKPSAEYVAEAKTTDASLNYFMVFAPNEGGRENPMERYLLLSMGKDGAERWMNELAAQCARVPLIHGGVPF